MKKILIILPLLVTLSGAMAQEMSINVLQSPATMPAGSTGQIRVDVCNNDPSADKVLAPYKIIATIQVNAYVEITGTTQLPTGWSECSRTTQTISISNGSDATLMPGECRTFFIDVKAGPTIHDAEEVEGTLSFAGGTDATKCEEDPGSSDDNVASNNSSKSSVKVTQALPVTLIAFNVSKQENSALLEWKTSAETNSDFFEIQTSPDAIKWKPIGSVLAVGESSIEKSYHFVDATPNEMKNYYRLRMVDHDGTFAYSSIKTLSFDGGRKTFVYPIPASQSLTVETASWSTLEKMELIDAKGKTVFDSGKLIVNQIDIKSVANGIYVLRLIRKDGSVETVKTMIVH